MKGNTEILLLNSAAVLPPHSSFHLPGKEQFAPLGLHCLAQLEPTRISVIDLQFAHPSEEFFSSINRSAIHTVILRAGRNHEVQHLKSMVSACRVLFPDARVGLAGTINKNHVGLGDFYIYGTGHMVVLHALRGEKLKGFINHLQAELEMTLPLPEKPFPDVYNFSARPEKQISSKTLEVFQPWLGLHEYSERIQAYPGLTWISGLTTWLSKSGFSELHFRPSGITPAHIHEMRSIMLNQKTQFAVSFKTCEPEELENNCAGAPLSQIWFYQPAATDIGRYRKCIEKVNQGNCLAGLAIDHSVATTPELGDLLSRADRFCILDAENWDLHDLKKVLLKFWGHKNRFFKKLFKIRSAADLVAFMKISALLLEILFSTDRKRGK
ncbi:MAG: hypothetical protein ACOYXC_19150 [Candidatus Rifleibacteriota bacterium]